MTKGPWNYTFWKGDEFVAKKNLAEDKLNDLTAARYAITIGATRVKAELDETATGRAFVREVWQEGRPLPKLWHSDGSFR